MDDKMDDHDENFASLDLYDDLITDEGISRQDNYDELSRKYDAAVLKIKELESEVDTLRKSESKLSERCGTLEKNISTLFLTARLELQRKDKILQHYNLTKSPRNQTGSSSAASPQLNKVIRKNRWEQSESEKDSVPAVLDRGKTKRRLSSDDQEEEVQKKRKFSDKAADYGEGNATRRENVSRTENCRQNTARKILEKSKKDIQRRSSIEKSTTHLKDNNGENIDREKNKGSREDHCSANKSRKNEKKDRDEKRRRNTVENEKRNETKRKDRLTEIIMGKDDIVEENVNKKPDSGSVCDLREKLRLKRMSDKRGINKDNLFKENPSISGNSNAATDERSLWSSREKMKSLEEISSPKSRSRNRTAEAKSPIGLKSRVGHPAESFDAKESDHKHSGIAANLSPVSKLRLDHGRQVTPKRKSAVEKVSNRNSDKMNSHWKGCHSDVTSNKHCKDKISLSDKSSHPVKSSSLETTLLDSTEKCPTAKVKNVCTNSKKSSSSSSHSETSSSSKKSRKDSIDYYDLSEVESRTSLSSLKTDEEKDRKHKETSGGRKTRKNYQDAQQKVSLFFDKSQELSTVLGSDKSQELSTVLGSDKSQELSTVLGSDKSQELSAVLGSDKSQELSTVLGSDKSQELSAVLGSDKSQKLSAVLGSDKSLVLSAVLGSDKSQKLSAVLGSDKSKELSTVLDSDKSKELSTVLCSDKSQEISIVPEKFGSSGVPGKARNSEESSVSVSNVLKDSNSNNTKTSSDFQELVKKKVTDTFTHGRKEAVNKSGETIQAEESRIRTRHHSKEKLAEKAKNTQENSNKTSEMKQVEVKKDLKESDSRKIDEIKSLQKPEVNLLKQQACQRHEKELESSPNLHLDEFEKSTEADPEANNLKSGKEQQSSTSKVYTDKQSSARLKDSVKIKTENISSPDEKDLASLKPKVMDELVSKTECMISSPARKSREKLQRKAIGVVTTPSKHRHLSEVNLNDLKMPAESKSLINVSPGSKENSVGFVCHQQDNLSHVQLSKREKMTPKQNHSEGVDSAVEKDLYLCNFVFENNKETLKEKQDKMESQGNEELDTESQKMEKPEPESQGIDKPDTESKDMVKPDCESQDMKIDAESQGLEKPDTELKGMEKFDKEAQGMEKMDFESQGIEKPDCQSQRMEKHETESQDIEKPDTKLQEIKKHETESQEMETLDFESQVKEKLDNELQGMEKLDESQGMEKPHTESQGMEKQENESREMEKPDTESQEMEKPDTESQEMEKPDTESQEMEKPDTESHEMEKLDNDSPKMEKPGTESQEMEKPNTESHEMEKLDNDSPKMEKSDNDSPKIKKPDTESQVMEKVDTVICGVEKRNAQVCGQEKPNIELDDKGISSSANEEFIGTLVCSRTKIKSPVKNSKQQLILTDSAKESLLITDSDLNKTQGVEDDKTVNRKRSASSVQSDSTLESDLEMSSDSELEEMSSNSSSEENQIEVSEPYFTPDIKNRTSAQDKDIHGLNSSYMVHTSESGCDQDTIEQSTTGENPSDDPNDIDVVCEEQNGQEVIKTKRSDMHTSNGNSEELNNEYESDSSSQSLMQEDDESSGKNSRHLNKNDQKMTEELSKLDTRAEDTWEDELMLYVSPSESMEFDTEEEDVCKTINVKKFISPKKKVHSNKSKREDDRKSTSKQDALSFLVTEEHLDKRNSCKSSVRRPRSDYSRSSHSPEMDGRKSSKRDGKDHHSKRKGESCRNRVEEIGRRLHCDVERSKERERKGKLFELKKYDEHQERKDRDHSYDSPRISKECGRKKSSRDHHSDMERASRDLHNNRERMSTDRHGNTERTFKDRHSDTERTSKDRYSDTERTSKDRHSDKERTSKEHVCDVERTSKDRLRDTERTSKDRHSDTERTSKDRHSDTERTSKDRHSDTERTSKDRHSDTERTSKDRHSDTERTSKDRHSDTERTSKDRHSDKYNERSSMNHLCDKEEMIKGKEKKLKEKELLSVKERTFINDKCDTDSMSKDDQNKKDGISEIHQKHQNSSGKERSHSSKHRKTAEKKVMQKTVRNLEQKYKCPKVLRTVTSETIFSTERSHTVRDTAEVCEHNPVGVHKVLLQDEGRKPTGHTDILGTGNITICHTDIQGTGNAAIYQTDQNSHRYPIDQSKDRNKPHTVFANKWPSLIGELSQNTVVNITRTDSDEEDIEIRVTDSSNNSSDDFLSDVSEPEKCARVRSWQEVAKIFRENVDIVDVEEIGIETDVKERSDNDDCLSDSESSSQEDDEESDDSCYAMDSNYTFELCKNYDTLSDGEDGHCTSFDPNRETVHENTVDNRDPCLPSPLEVCNDNAGDNYKDSLDDGFLNCPVSIPKYCVLNEESLEEGEILTDSEEKLDPVPDTKSRKLLSCEKILSLSKTINKTDKPRNHWRIPKSNHQGNGTGSCSSDRPHISPRSSSSPRKGKSPRDEMYRRKHLQTAVKVLRNRSRERKSNAGTSPVKVQRHDCSQNKDRTDLRNRIRDKTCGSPEVRLPLRKRKRSRSYERGSKIKPVSPRRS